ncbi:MAG TPA: tripartite tricarboxylate transporter TctB family protein [Nocardioides sp.]|nr:tripartite tricarboxylate transporter TctB family protein [Nocardioides sp.]
MIATSEIGPDHKSPPPGTSTSAADGQRRHARDDLVLGGVLAAITVVYGVQTLALPEDSPNQADIGPRAYPLLILLLLALGTLLLVAQALVRWRATSVADRTSADAGEGVSTQSTRRRYVVLRLAAVVVVTLAYLQMMELLGFLVATAIYLAVETVLIGGVDRYRGRRAWVPVVFGCVAALAIYLVFGRSLGVLLPHGPFVF